MEKKSTGNGVQYGLDVVADAAHKQGVACLGEGKIADAQKWFDLAEDARVAVVGQLLDAIENAEIDRSANIADVLRGWGVL